MDTSLRHGQCYIAGRCFAVSHSKAKLRLIAPRRRHKAAARGPEKGFRYIAVCTRAAELTVPWRISWSLRPVTRVRLRNGLIFDDKDPRDVTMHATVPHAKIGHRLGQRSISGRSSAKRVSGCSRVVQCTR